MANSSAQHRKSHVATAEVGARRDAVLAEGGIVGLEGSQNWRLHRQFWCGGCFDVEFDFDFEFDFDLTLLFTWSLNSHLISRKKE